MKETIEKRFVSVNCTTRRCPFTETCTQLKAELVKTRDDDDFDIILVGQGAGEKEAASRSPFTGPAGRLLRTELKPLIIEEKLNIILDNIIRCRPLDERGKNRAPTEEEVRYCIGHLWWIIETYKPTLIVPLGASATHSVAPNLKGRTITSLRGKIHYYNNRMVYPTYHPAACLHADKERGEAIRQNIQRDLKDAVSSALGQLNLL